MSPRRKSSSMAASTSTEARDTTMKARLTRRAVLKTAALASTAVAAPFVHGAYAAGKNPKLDTAIRMQPEIIAFLRQQTSENSSFEETRERLRAIAEKL